MSHSSCVRRPTFRPGTSRGQEAQRPCLPGTNNNRRYKFIDSQHTRLEDIAGIGYQRLEPRTLVKNSAGTVIARRKPGSEGDAAGTAGINFARLSKSTKLTDKLLVASGSLDTSVANDLALTVAMSDRLALSVAYGIRENTKPAPGVNKLDQLTSLNGAYNIKQGEGLHMSFASEFKEFAMKGNVIDLAVGVVIGAAFGKIVSSLVGDVIMPVVGVLTGGADFSSYAVPIGTDPKGAPVLLKYGAFAQSVLDFLIIALAIFVAIRAINRLKRPAPPPANAAPPLPPRQEVLLEEIRDLLSRRGA